MNPPIDKNAEPPDWFGGSAVLSDLLVRQLGDPPKDP